MVLSRAEDALDKKSAHLEPMNGLSSDHLRNFVETTVTLVVTISGRHYGIIEIVK